MKIDIERQSTRARQHQHREECGENVGREESEDLKGAGDAAFKKFKAWVATKITDIADILRYELLGTPRILGRGKTKS